MFIGNPPGHPAISYVGIDNRSAARSVTQQLLDTGRQRVAMVACALDRDSGSDRLAGFRDALGDRFDPRLVVDHPLYAYTSGLEGARELLRRDPGIDGVFAASDAVAAGVLEALREAGRSVPGDVGVVGFDDSAWALRCVPPLSTVRQPARLMGRRRGDCARADPGRRGGAGRRPARHRGGRARVGLRAAGAGRSVLPLGPSVPGHCWRMPATTSSTMRRASYRSSVEATHRFPMPRMST